jgi:demethylmenaquinone methyltransferase/2-methoxy-6-polyprenyl-1,4-benzoquinol methylase
MNDLMSLGLQRVWKRFTLEMSGVRAGARVLDVASGSGDLAAAFARRVGPTGEVWMTDINARDASVGRDKLIDAASSRRSRCATRRSCRFPMRASTASRSPSAFAT